MFDILIRAGELYLWSMLAGGVVLAALVLHDHIRGYVG